MSTTTDATAGLMLLDDIEAVTEGLANGDWLSVTLGSVSTVSSMIDPIGTLFENGVGWLLEHIEPLSTMLHELTGDPAQVQALAQSWLELGASLLGASEDLVAAIRSDLAEFAGLTAEVYRNVQGENSAIIAKIGEMCESVQLALENASQMVQTVHDIVRDVIATIVGMILSALATAWIPIAGQGWLIYRVLDAVLEFGPIATKAADAIKHAFGLLQDLLGQAGKVMRNIPGFEALASAGFIGRHSDEVVDAGRHADEVLDAGRYVTGDLRPGATGEDLLVTGNRYGTVDGRPIRSQEEWDEIYTYRVTGEDGVEQTRISWPDPAYVPGTKRSLSPEEFAREYGTTIDRIGGERGTWFSPIENGRPHSFESRAIAPSSLNEPYNQMTFDPSNFPDGYKFEVSEVAEGLGQPGGAMQLQVVKPNGVKMTMLEMLRDFGVVTW